MRKTLYILLGCICLSFNGLKPDFSEDFVNVYLLETMLVERINDEREKENRTRLVQNEILIKAAEDQAKYISKKGILSHRQPSKDKAKARNRVEFYGGKMQGVGENTAYLMVFNRALFKGDNGQIDTVNINSINLAVDYFVYAWMNSVPHKTNIMYADYTETGVKVMYNKERKALYAVQVFAFPYK